MKTETEFRIGPGMSSLLMIMVTLLMAALAILAMASAQNDRTLSQRNLQTTQEYFQTSAKMQQLLSEVDLELVKAREEAAGDTQAYIQKVQALQGKYALDIPVESSEEQLGQVTDGSIQESGSGAAVTNDVQPAEEAPDEASPIEEGALDEAQPTEGVALDEAQPTEAGSSDGSQLVAELSDSVSPSEEQISLQPADAVSPENANDDALLLRLSIPMSDDHMLVATLNVSKELSGPRYTLISHLVLDTAPWDEGQSLDLFGN